VVVQCAGIDKRTGNGLESDRADAGLEDLRGKEERQSENLSSLDRAVHAGFDPWRHVAHRHRQCVRARGPFVIPHGQRHDIGVLIGIDVAGQNRPGAADFVDLHGLSCRAVTPVDRGCVRIEQPGIRETSHEADQRTLAGDLIGAGLHRRCQILHADLEAGRADPAALIHHLHVGEVCAVFKVAVFERETGSAIARGCTPLPSP